MTRAVIFFATILLAIVLQSDFVVAHGPDENDTVVVTITDEGFKPKDVTITQGDEVSFVNKSSRISWPASDIHPTHSRYPGSDIRKCETQERSQIFDSCGRLDRGEEYSFVFTKTGTWRFHDHLNPSSGGVIEVKLNPDYAETQTAKEENVIKGNFLNMLSKEIKVFFQKQYYVLFPDKRLEKLSDLNMLLVSVNDEALEYWMRVFGSEAVIDDLVADAGDNTFIGCHLEAHLVGRMASKLEDRSPFEDVIDIRCQHGFFHGLLEASLGSREETEYISEVIEYCSDFDSRKERLLCNHGAGHGILISTNYDLPQTANYCLEFTEHFDQTSCLSGVFMENAVAASEYAPNAGHDSKWIDPDDPKFPCSYFEGDEFLYGQCFALQAFNLFPNFSSDLDQIMNVCDQTGLRSATRSCYWGIGFYIASPLFPLDVEAVAEVCRASRGNNFDGCVDGALEMIGFIRTSQRNIDISSAVTELCSYFPDYESECLKKFDGMMNG